MNDTNADSASGSDTSVLGSGPYDFTVAQPEPLLVPRFELQHNTFSSTSQSPDSSPRRSSPRNETTETRRLLLPPIQISPVLPAVPPAIARVYHELWAGVSRHASSAAEASSAALDDLEQNLVASERDGEISACLSFGNLSEGGMGGAGRPRLSRPASR